MAEAPHGINSVADQRYYHFLLWKTRQEPSLPVLWRRMGEMVEPSRPRGWQNSHYLIQHKKLRSRLSYTRASVAERLSSDGEGSPPFYHDVFVMTVGVERASYLLIGFPFVNLALEMLKPLVDKYGHDWEQQCAKVPRLLPILEDGQVLSSEGLSTRVVGVQWSVQSDASLTSIRLGGDAPLKADLYLEYLRPLARQKKSPLVPEKCSLAFGREGRTGESADEGALMRARLHVDLEGAFRFYAQAGCKNISLLPFAIGHLWSLGCIEKARTDSPWNALRATDGSD